MAQREIWAKYLRVSDEDKQSPERSFAMQNEKIDKYLLEPSENAEVFGIYKDLLSGKKSNRADYQRMLADARAGKFTHLAMYRADRFGRNSLEGLSAVKELISHDIKVRVANMPSLHPETPDGEFMFMLQMGMAQREVDVLGERTSDGMRAKIMSGNWAWKAPEGYRNKERLISSNKYDRWVELDTEFSQPIREAFDILLMDQCNVREICEELNKRGYTRSSGRPWAWTIAESGRRKTADTSLNKIFHNSFYAGWVISPANELARGDVRGNWEPIVTDEEFDRGLEILHKNDQYRNRKKKYVYQLGDVLWVRTGTKKVRLYGSSPHNKNKTYHYYRTLTKPNGQSIRFACEEIEQQIEDLLSCINVPDDVRPEVQRVYEAEIASFSQKNLEQSIISLEQEVARARALETNLLRKSIYEDVSEDSFNQVLVEVQEKRMNAQARLRDYQRDLTVYISDLELGLTLLGEVSILFKRLTPDKKKALLNILLKRVVVDTAGQVIDFKLHAPFAYIHGIAKRSGDDDDADSKEDFLSSIQFKNAGELGKLA